VTLCDIENFMTPETTETEKDGADSSAPIGSASPVNQPSQTVSCFRVMEEEQAEDYREYLRQCKGAPPSTVKPSDQTYCQNCGMMNSQCECWDAVNHVS
jgi:hypothetical protein